MVAAGLLVAAAALAGPAAAAATPMAAKIEALVPELEAYIASGMKDFDDPGLAIGIVSGDRLVYAKGFGVAPEGRPAGRHPYRVPDRLDHQGVPGDDHGDRRRPQEIRAGTTASSTSRRTSSSRIPG